MKGRLEEKEKQLDALLGNRPEAFRREPEREPDDENGDKEEEEEEQKPETDRAGERSPTAARTAR